MIDVDAFQKMVSRRLSRKTQLPLCFFSCLRIDDVACSYDDPWTTFAVLMWVDGERHMFGGSALAQPDDEYDYVTGEVLAARRCADFVADVLLGDVEIES
jgi:hypothetical protein